MNSHDGIIWQAYYLDTTLQMTSTSTALASVLIDFHEDIILSILSYVADAPFELVDSGELWSHRMSDVLMQPRIRWLLLVCMLHVPPSQNNMNHFNNIYTHTTVQFLNHGIAHAIQQEDREHSILPTAIPHLPTPYHWYVNNSINSYPTMMFIGNTHCFD